MKVSSVRNESTFLDLLLDHGEIDSTILTTDSSLQQRIQDNHFLNGRRSMFESIRDYHDGAEAIVYERNE